MSEPTEFTPAEQSLCHRLVTLVDSQITRALREQGVPLAEPRQSQSAEATGRAAANFIVFLRSLDEGMPVADQNQWIGSVVTLILKDVWGLTFPETAPTEALN